MAFALVTETDYCVRNMSEYEKIRRTKSIPRRLCLVDMVQVVNIVLPCPSQSLIQ